MIFSHPKNPMDREKDQIRHANAHREHQ
jgi:hypothetical protein